MIAQRHADQCRFAHDCTGCRRVARFDVGQNLYIHKQSERPASVDWERVVRQWYQEGGSFSREQVGFIA